MYDVALQTIYVIFPILIIVSVGYLSAKVGWIKDNAVESLTKLVFYVGAPVLLFDDISKTNMSTFFQLKGPIVLIIVSTTMASFGYFLAIIKKLPPSQKGVWAMSSFRANMAFVGLPVAISALGDKGGEYSALVLALGVPVFNILSVIFLNLPHQGSLSFKSVKKAGYEMVTNPLIIACTLGTLFSFIRPDEIPIIDLTLSSLKKLTLPLALIAIGSRLNIKQSIIHLPRIFLVVINKLILTPLFGGILLYLFGAGKYDFIATVLLLGSPVAVVSYVMAGEMKGDVQESSTIILSTTFLSFFSMALILFILGILGIWDPVG